ncbi:MAG: hypothetical protein LHV69_07575 [Elusimicrobia bacterium]|nr:hypothetical protein [Candidatus Obscuribacterium magneticum]
MTQFGVSYFGNRFVSHAQSDIKRIADACDYIVHTVSETDLTFHKAVLDKIIRESRKAGLEVWADPWGLGGVFGGEALSRFLLEHRDSWQMMSDGRVMPAACLNRPEWRSFMMEWILTVRDMGAQVVFWDEPHISFDFDSEWEGIYSCVCAACQGLFKKQVGASLPTKLNDAARQFRLETMKSFLNDLMSFVHAQGMKNALCLYAFKGNEEYDRVWKEAAALRYVDILGCDPYWRWHTKHDVTSHVGEFSRLVLDHARPHQKSSQIWIQAMRLPAGAEQEIPKACEIAVKEGVTHIAAWSYDGGELLDPVLSERPNDVWHVVEQTFKRLRSA